MAHSNAAPVHPYWIGPVQYRLDTTIDNSLYGDHDARCCNIQTRKKRLTRRQLGAEGAKPVAAAGQKARLREEKRRRRTANESQLLIGSGLALAAVAAVLLFWAAGSARR